MQRIYKKRLTVRPRILAISDIHGHLGGLKLLLKSASYRPKEDRLFLLGDYIDQSPDTWTVLAEIEYLYRHGAAAILGNKELEWLAGQQARPVKHPLYSFIRALPLYIKEEKYIFVHAGIRPGIKMHKQTAADCTTIREPFLFEDPQKKRLIVFGHTPTYRLGAAPGDIWQGKGKLDIDTGAKHNLRLTLVDLTNRRAYSCSTASENRYGDLQLNDW